MSIYIIYKQHPYQYFNMQFKINTIQNITYSSELLLQTQSEIAGCENANLVVKYTLNDMINEIICDTIYVDISFRKQVTGIHFLGTEKDF